MSDFKPVPQFDRNTTSSPDHLNAQSEAVYQLQQLVVALYSRLVKVEGELASLELVEDEAPAKPATGRAAPKTAAK